MLCKIFKTIFLISDNSMIVLYKSEKLLIILKYVDSTEEAEKELNRFANLIVMG